MMRVSQWGKHGSPNRMAPALHPPTREYKIAGPNKFVEAKTVDHCTKVAGWLDESVEYGRSQCLVFLKNEPENVQL